MSNPMHHQYTLYSTLSDEHHAVKEFINDNMTLSPTSVIDSNASASSSFTRDSSPSPSISPTPALSACPPLDRSFSAASSTVSSFSKQSVTSRSSSASTALRQRGYVRPQGVSFAPSAGNRDSVLSLGSIAHLQYYFARTGLLDGKGAQLAKEKDQKINPGVVEEPFSITLDDCPSPSDHDGNDAIESSVGEEDMTRDWVEPMMLPPTVSTYSHRVQFIAPPPNSEMLRHDLKLTLLDAKQTLQEIEDHNVEALDRRKDQDDHPHAEGGKPHTRAADSVESQGWYEIQGLHILDVVTLAIRAAKMYYTTHEHPQRLYSIKSERQIREELLGVMDVLKRMASRNFAGGMRTEELKVIQCWVKGIETFITDEKVLETQEAKERGRWKWLEGSWDHREREREWLFMSSFLQKNTLPEWTAINNAKPLMTPFLEALRNGLTLIRLHNAVLKKSKRQFGEIKSFHTDTAKPYRCAENLRYWIKESEIRWEIKLKVDVTGVVHGKNDAWPNFDAAIMQWCKAAREELTKEWEEDSIRMPPQGMYRGD